MKIKLNAIALTITALSVFPIFAQPSQAEELCQVADPTGTPLNVRATPNGRVINALRNGREVSILDTAYDNRGRPWARVGGSYQGEWRNWGWVFQEYINCYNRQSRQSEEVCQVTDPTGTPLNVRATPNGRVINALRNGREVYILDTAYDNRSRPWAKVGGYYQREWRNWGWVFREFVSCYDR